jgi:hypothetical protein
LADFRQNLDQTEARTTKGFALFFVNQLSGSWVKRTGNKPTRVYDAYSNRETRDFYAYCKAAATTVSGMYEIGSIDAAFCTAQDPARAIVAAL